VCDGYESTCASFNEYSYWSYFQKDGTVRCNSNCTFDFSECM
jgi:hypothetical protein